MATLSFDDDRIIGNDALGTSVQIPASSSTITITTTPGSAITFNPFGNVTVLDTGGGTADGGGDLVRFRLTFSNVSGGTNGETLFTVNNGTTSSFSAANSGTFGGNSTHDFEGTALEAQTWLRRLYVIDSQATDSFVISLRGIDQFGNLQQSRNISYRLIAACYMQGTMIRTPQGERAVESLRAGDMVTVLDGTARAVKWIGHRTYEAEFGAQEAFVRPVVFKAGSLGDGLPVRDLKVSPQHGMWIDGAMVPAAALVNGVSVVRDMAPGAVSYFHIELDGHEAVFAEGAPSETFVDHDSRALFDNADEYNLLHGTSAARPAEQPRVREGFQLAAIRRRLAEIAGITTPAAAGPMMGNLESIQDGILTGWAVDAAGADAVEAEVLVDGEVVARIVANGYRADLDQAGINGGLGGFSVALPPSAERLEQVSLRRIVDGKVLAGAVVETAQA